MITNNKITIYHKSGLDVATRLEKWTRYNYDNVWVFKRKSANITNQIDNTNNIEIRIPYNKNQIDINNLTISDIIVIGHLDIDIETAQDLKGYETYIITSITDNKIGLNQHIHIGGK
jgi:hypothetical protein